MSAVAKLKAALAGATRKKPEVKRDRSCVLIMNEQGQFLAVFRAPYKTTHPCTWGLPGGQKDKGEKSKKTAGREGEEETGLILTDATKIRTFKDRGRVCTDFIALARGDQTVKLDGEATAYKWVSIYEWPEPAHSGVKELIQGKLKEIEAFAWKHKINLARPKQPERKPQI